MKQNLILFFALLFSFSAYGQEFQFQAVGNLAELGGQVKIQIPPEDLSRVKGEVLDERGKPIANANIVLCGETMFFADKSNKKGDYSVGGRYGNYTIVAFAAGYKKQSVEVELGRGRVSTLNFKLEPIAQAKSTSNKGDIIRAGFGSYTIVYDAKNPAYASQSLYDKLCNLPCVELSDDIYVSGERNVSLYLNNKEARVPMQSFVKMLKSIEAQQVTAIKVMKGNKFQNLAPSIFVSYK